MKKIVSLMMLLVFVCVGCATEDSADTGTSTDVPEFVQEDPAQEEEAPPATEESPDVDPTPPLSIDDTETEGEEPKTEE